MARPRKVGLEYFPVDTAFEEDVEAFIAAYGNDALSFVLRWWQTAYGNGTGLVCLNDPIARARLAERVRVSAERLMQLAEAAAAIGIVDPKRWSDARVLTSHDVQKRLAFIQQERARDRARKPKNLTPPDSSPTGYPPGFPVGSPGGFPAENGRDNAGETAGKRGERKGKERERVNSLSLSVRTTEDARGGSDAARPSARSQATRPVREQLATPPSVGTVLASMRRPR